MRVGLNLLWMTPGVVGGTEIAATGMLRALLALDSADLDLRVYAQDEFVRAHGDLAQHVATRTVHIPKSSGTVRVGLESTWLAMALRRDRVQATHCYGGVVAIGLPSPIVLTLHDVQPLEAGAILSETKRRWLRMMIPSSVRRAKVVIVPSAYVRDRLCALVDVDPTTVQVIPHGVTDRQTKSDAAIEQVKLRFRLDGPYFVYPAITYPHKNHAVLLDAVSRIARESAHPPTLVFTGGVGSSEAAIAQQIERLGLASYVRRVGRVSPDELNALMQGATSVVFPSKYEGFGLPVIEAFGLGTPVIASNAGSLPEVVGDAGALVDPEDSGAWAQAMLGAMGGAFGSTEAVQRRTQQVNRFHWDRIVPEILDLYLNVGGS